MEYRCVFSREILDYSRFQWMDAISLHDSGVNYFVIRAKTVHNESQTLFFVEKKTKEVSTRVF